jgi:hypothetical protein
MAQRNALCHTSAHGWKKLRVTAQCEVFLEAVMDVMIIATKACTHRKNMEKELECLRIPYRVCFVEDCADLVQKFSIRHSPNSGSGR